MKYFTRVSDSTEQKIGIDLDFYHNLPNAKRLYSLWVFIKSTQIDALQERITQELQQSHKAQFVAIREADGWSELYYYATNEKGFTKLIQQIMSEYNLLFECGSHKDNRCRLYLEELYPSELEFHQIESRHIIETLLLEGDTIEQPREVEHYAFFQTEANMLRFVEAIKELGFHLKQSIIQSESDYPYGAIVAKEHSVTLEVVQNTIADLLEKIMLEHGYYEGWSTTLSSKG